MIKRYFTFLMFLFCTLLINPVSGRDHDSTDIDKLQMWIAGTTVSTKAVDAFGIQRCFSADKIPDKVWERMSGKTFVKNPHIGRKDLRYLRLLHWDFDNQAHIGELVCNKQIAIVLVDIFRELYEKRYPIQRMVLPDYYGADDELQMRDNNTSCFCYRVVRGSNTISNHSLGLAVDINPLYNPYYKDQAGKQRFVQPSTASAYCDRSKKFRYKIDENDLAYQLFTRKGFKWGGAWRSCKDFQHFEYEVKDKSKRR